MIDLSFDPISFSEMNGGKTGVGVKKNHVGFKTLEDFFG
jgi:hypothetical protein